MVDEGSLTLGPPPSLLAVGCCHRVRGDKKLSPWVSLLHPAAVVSQDFTFLAEMLRVFFALIRDIQPIGFFQGSLHGGGKDRGYT